MPGKLFHPRIFYLLIFRQLSIWMKGLLLQDCTGALREDFRFASAQSQGNPYFAALGASRQQALSASCVTNCSFILHETEEPVCCCSLRMPPSQRDSNC